jgi:hypothetical protein
LAGGGGAPSSTLYIGSTSRSIVDVAVDASSTMPRRVLGSKPTNAWYPPVPPLRQ